jgi:hypothetical protein
VLTFHPPLTSAEVATLRAFRRTARVVHRIYGPLASRPLTVDLQMPGEPRTKSLPEDAVRSLAIAVRQPELEREPGNFERVVQVLERAQDDEVRKFCAAVRDQWRFALVSPPSLQIEGHTYSGEDVFKTWLYARAVHQDENRQEHAERLAASGPVPSWIVQLVIRHRAIAILSLDTGVAEALEEDQLEDAPLDSEEIRYFGF